MEAALHHDGHPVRHPVGARSGPLVTFTRAAETFVLWAHGPRAPHVHLFLGYLSAGWAAVMTLNPDIFDSNRLGYAALNVLPDPVWVIGHAVLVALHVLGLARPTWGGWRAAACLGSAWVYLFLAFSLGRANGLTPGAMAWLGVGIAAVGYGLYVAWRPPEHR